MFSPKTFKEMSGIGYLQMLKSDSTEAGTMAENKPFLVCDVPTEVRPQRLIKSGEAIVRLCIVLTQVLSRAPVSLVSCHLHRRHKGEKKNEPTV